MAEDQDATTYFQGESEVVNENVSKIAKSFGDVRERVLRKIQAETGERPDESTILSEMYRVAVEEEIIVADDDDEKRVRAFFKSFDYLLADFADQMSIEGFDVESNTDRAVFNQQLAQDLYVLNHRSIGDPQRKAAEMFWSIAMTLNKEDGLLGKEAILALNGARAQAGIALVLEEQGYDIIYPNPQDPEEVKEWDIKAKADFVAISPEGDFIVLVDAKGKLMLNDDERRLVADVEANGPKIGDYHYEERVQSTNAIRDQLSKIDNRIHDSTRIKHCEIIVPSDIKLLGPLGRIVDHRIKDTIKKGVELY